MRSDSSARLRRTVTAAVIAVLLLAAAAAAAEMRFPPPEFESGHQLPQTIYPPTREPVVDAVAVFALAVALGLASWLSLRRRSRKGMVALSIASLIYFGFYREGCICVVGSLQNVTLSLFNSGYVVPLAVVLFFALPLVFALLFGRVFCAGVCPLGAIQDLVLIRPVKVSRRLAGALGIIPFAYLGLAVLLAATDSMFIICQYDPFVAFFRRSGAFPMLVAGGIVVLLSMFVGRPYCRFACPYRVLLGLASRFAWRHATITPDDCIVCGLCEEACPFDVIQRPTPEGVPDGL